MDKEEVEMLQVYLAGTLGGQDKRLVISRRAKVVRMLRRAGFAVYDPAATEHALWSGRKTIPNDFSMNTMRSFVNKDLRWVRKADIMYVLTGDTPTDGTWDEKNFSYMIGGIVVMVAPKRRAGELVSFSNVRSHYLAKTDEDAIRWLRKHVKESKDGGVYVR